jgi:hypothetical protein
MPGFESRFTDRMLLEMMRLAQTDAPSVGWFEAGASVGADAHVSAFDRQLTAARDGAAMPPDPRAVRCAGPRASFARLTGQRRREAQLRQCL